MGLSAGDELNIVDVVERTLVVQKQDRRKAALGTPGLPQLDASPRLQIRSGRGQRAVKAFFDTDIRERANRPSTAPRMLRSALGSAHRAARAQAPRCAADPGPTLPAPIWVPALRSSAKSAAPRPGHGWSMLSPPFGDAPAGRFVVTFQADLGSPVLFAKIFRFPLPPNHL
ncbi:MAG TPA: hypothetical protein VGA15_09195 [Bradyrhizobium sp.]